MSTQDIDGVSLMGDEEILHDVGISFWLASIGTHIKKKLGIRPRYIVTTERVIHVNSSWTGTTTNEYPIRDIHQLSTDSSTVEEWFDVGSIQFSVGGGGEKVSIDGIPEHQIVANSIRERQRELAES